MKKRRDNKVHDKKILDKGWQRERNINRKNRWEKKDFIREYSRFERNSNTLPNYMKTNLSEMPNNKGYIWKNIRFYGELPAQRNQPDVLFEKLRGGILRIHEITSHEHLIFEKRGRERKTLIKTIPRRQMDNSINSIKKFIATDAKKDAPLIQQSHWPQSNVIDKNLARKVEQKQKRKVFSPRSHRR